MLITETEGPGNLQNVCCFISDFDADGLKEFLNNPSESLGVEIKQWLDLKSNHGKSKIVKACIALRNNNGGILIVGFCDDGSPDLDHLPKDPRKDYHADIIQGMVSKYSSELFEVVVGFINFQGMDYPIITVPSGVRTPVACKSDLKENGNNLLKKDAVYVRTLHSNNTVSSSEARYKDWERVVQHCFDNRESDIGAFIRRHLSGLEYSDLVDFLQKQGTSKSITSEEAAVSNLDECYSRFLNEAEKRDYMFPPQLGFREASVVIDGELPSIELSEEMLWKLHAVSPRHSGWPPWVMLLGCADQKPYVLENAWEAFIIGDTLGLHLDYWRFDQKGRFYHLRALQDDMRALGNNVPGIIPAPTQFSGLDFTLQISRTAEIISTIISFAKELGVKPESTSLAIAMRWRNIEGRHLTSWVEPQRMFRSTSISHQNEITTSATVPLDTPANAIAPYVEKIVKPLFALFGGTKIENNIIDEIVQKTIGRQY
ncbi:AlbA family DNA-binding domain-containing protein [Gimesia panareensis]|uniref:AlbA family DNA-binding domain-containing protein n=1 Tax=Gimesia panareensis TaxID=2527978 RepID=UPI00118CADEB|nr:RNA-binding domain-containing protein [Gimesia panareensis]QDU49995.1 Divergent AAA domain protein [Gimesia panareensis]